MVLIETVDCHVVPYKRGAIKPLYIANIDHQHSKGAYACIRLEIINLKGGEPKVARMEVIKSNHMISEEELERAEKGDKRALEMIRSRLAHELAKKIEETVCVKK